MNDELNFFRYTMPESRPADYYLGCLDGSVFIDFDNCKDERIRLSRVSFDGYGCCELKGKATPMDEVDSKAFKEIMTKQLTDQILLTTIVKNTISNNRKLIWEDALSEYGLI